MKKKLFNNLSWLFFDKVIRIFGGLFIGVWVARYLGPDDFGLLNYGIAYIALFILFVTLGLEQIVVREIVKKPKLSHYILGTAFVLRLLGAVFAFGATLISLSFMNLENDTSIIIIVLSISFLFQSIEVIDCHYQANLLSKYIVIARNSAFILTSALKVFFIVYKFPVIFFAIAYVLDFALSGLLLLTIFKYTKGEMLKWRFSYKIAGQLLKYSWPLALSTFLITVYMKIDQVMIGNLLNTERVGIYSVAVRLSEFWLFIPSIMVTTFMPYFIRLREENNELYYSRLMQLYSLMFWMGVGVGTLSLLFGEIFIKLLFGDAYIDAYTALVFNIWSGIAISQGLARGIWLISEDLQRYRLYSNIIAVILNIALNLVLIPKYGITGAAIATLLTQSLSVWLFPFFWRPMRESTTGMLRSINPLYLLGKRL